MLVTGRSAGWADAFARQWPVDAVVAENGGMAFLCGPNGLSRLYSTPPAKLAADRKRLFAAARRVAKQVKGAELSSDSCYTEVDLAIDYNEERHLGEHAATRIEALLRKEGLSAVRSSVHVNFWAGRFDKLSMCRRILKRLKLSEEEALYAGDSVNDEPMFRGFTHSVGVANVRDVLGQLEHWPAFVTRRREGKGFEEIVRRLLEGKRRATPDAGRRAG